MPTRVLIPSGVLGLGFDEDALWRGVHAKPDLIAIDGGSTDSGPASLGTGTSKYSRLATRSEWKTLMQARAKAGVPLVIGTCGTCGTDSTVDWMHEITRDIASELGQSLRVTRLYSEQSPEDLATALAKGAISPLDPAPDISDERLSTLSHAVALAGAEQIQAALATGADIILAGRTTDTAIIAALPLLRGDHPGGAWHGAKIGECGALCSTHPTSGVIQIDFDQSGFTVTPLHPDAACHPQSVSAHMLYENADPFVLFEPGGHLDVSQAHYSALDARRVRVEGAEWVPTEPYRVKLEGARPIGHQVSLLALLRQRRYVENARNWCAKLEAFLRDEITHRMALAPEHYHLTFRLIGIDATLGGLEAAPSNPVEIGVLCLVTSQQPETAREIAKLINPFLLHFPLTETEELPTFAFPYSPVHSDRGPVYEFALNHVMALDDPMAAFRLETEEI